VKVKTHTSFGFATQVCILDANGRVDRFIAAHDVGRAVNPALCEGARAVQVGTMNFVEPDIAGRLAAELRGYCEKEGIADINSLIGSLKTE
jgi:hypothetical protein